MEKKINKKREIIVNTIFLVCYCLLFVSTAVLLVFVIHKMYNVNINNSQLYFGILITFTLMYMLFKFMPDYILEIIEEIERIELK